jgi:hypothetical protein
MSVLRTVDINVSMTKIFTGRRRKYLQNRLPVVDGCLPRHCLQHFRDIPYVRKGVSKLVDSRLILGPNKASYSLVTLADCDPTQRWSEEPLFEQVAPLRCLCLI